MDEIAEDGYAAQEKPYFPGVIAQARKKPFVLSPPGSTPITQIPGSMNRYLRDYQREGAQFLYGQWAEGRGAILADDMGLGKTIQVIAFMSAVLGKTGTRRDTLRQQPSFLRKLSSGGNSEGTGETGYDRPGQPFLLVGPASVLSNWVEEFATWGYFSVSKFHGATKADTVSLLRSGRLDVAVTSFETCRDHVHTLNRFDWSAVVVDEAHKIKSVKAGVSQALSSLDCARRFGLTGTPLQNNLHEFWCIMSWANPGCLGTLRDFTDRYIRVLDAGSASGATKRQLAEARLAQQELARVKDKWMLRRTKALIADQLPKKEELVVYCPMAELQAEIYGAILASEHMQTLLTSRDPCTCKSGRSRRHCCYQTTSDGRILQERTFSYMHLLLKAANHIALLLANQSSQHKGDKKNDIAELIDQVFKKYPQFVEQSTKASFRTLSDPSYCGKMKVLAGLLTVFKKRKAKVLLFSYSTRLLDILEQYLMTKAYEYRRLDGSTSESRRQQLVHEFNGTDSIFLFLVSTKAGGVGLNLTGANVVIIFDPNWNPSHDLQAQDRAYRLGQTHDVRVYRLISAATIEENIYLRQVLKQQQARQAVEGQCMRRYFRQGELSGIRSLFTLTTQHRCVTEEILSRHQRQEQDLTAYRIEQYVAPPASPAETSEKIAKKQPEIDCSAVGNTEEDINSSGDEDCKMNPNERDRYSATTSDKMVDRKLTPFSSDRMRAVGMKKRKPAGKQELSETTQTERNRLFMDTDTEDEEDSSNYTRLRLKRDSALTAHSSGNIERVDRVAAKRSRSKFRGEGSQSKVKKGDIGLGAVNRGEDMDTEAGTSGRKARSGVVSGSSDQPSSGGQSVPDVFEACGIVHVHTPKHVLGASRVEEHVSRAALRDVFELQQFSQLPAEFCEEYVQQSEAASSEASRDSVQKGQGHEEVTWSALLNGRRVLGGQTPKTVRLQQFTALADWTGESESSLARRVISMSESERRELLRDFYTSRHPELADELTLRLSTDGASSKPCPAKPEVVLSRADSLFDGNRKSTKHSKPSTSNRDRGPATRKRRGTSDTERYATGEGNHPFRSDEKASGRYKRKDSEKRVSQSGDSGRKRYKPRLLFTGTESLKEKSQSPSAKPLEVGSKTVAKDSLSPLVKTRKWRDYSSEEDSLGFGAEGVKSTAGDNTSSGQTELVSSTIVKHPPMKVTATKAERIKNKWCLSKDKEEALSFVDSLLLGPSPSVHEPRDHDLDYDTNTSHRHKSNHRASPTGHTPVTQNTSRLYKSTMTTSADGLNKDDASSHVTSDHVIYDQMAHEQRWVRNTTLKFIDETFFGD